MPGQEPFPPGEYRLLLLDRGGQRDATRFVIPAQRRPTAAPEVAVDGARFEVHGTAPYQLWVGAEDGQVTTLDVAGSVDLKEHFDFRAGRGTKFTCSGRPRGLTKGFSVAPTRGRRHEDQHAAEQNRTADTRIFSPLLYHLSYSGRVSA